MNERMLQISNALTLADDMLATELKSFDNAAAAADVELLKRQVEHVLQTSRRVAGLEPDGSFKPVPPPAKKRGGR